MRRVQVAGGSYKSARVMSRQHISTDEQAPGTVLACCILAQSGLGLKVVGLLHKAVCRGGAVMPGGGPRPAG